MTRPRYRMRRTAVAGDSDMRATEHAALLGLPCPPDGNPFLCIRIEVDVSAGNGEGRAVWERHRKEILIDPHHPGTRPAAFWIYDCTQPDVPEHFRTGEPTRQEQAQYLNAHGLLTSAERKKLPKEWFRPTPPTLKVIPNGR